VLDSDNGGIRDQPIYAESLALRFRFGGPGVFALTTAERRYVRAARDEVVELGGLAAAPQADIHDAERLRAALDRLLEEHDIEPPEEIAAADEDTFAALGHLGGGVVATAEAPAMDPAEQARLVDAHRAAAMLVADKRYNAAIERLRGIVRAHPGLAVVHYQLGTLLDRTGRFEEAVAAFDAVKPLVPDNPYVPVAVARAFLDANLYEDADRQAALAVALADEGDTRAVAAAHEVAALAALASGDAERARAHARAAAEAIPAIPLPAFVRGRLLYDEGNYEEALAAFAEARQAADEHGRPLKDLHWYLGDTLARLDRFADAEAQFREELRAFPRNVRGYSSLAMLYRATSRDRAVEDVIGELIAAAPTPEGYVTAARLWTILGERARAQALRTDARTRFRDDPSLVLRERSPRPD
jgi:tetratricopeptide (TPR) repeat protein